MYRKFQRHLILFLFFALFSAGIHGSVQENAVHQLHRDIILLNLVNGLYLTPEQMEALVDKIEKAEQIQIEYSAKAEQRSNETEKVLTEIKEVLSKNQEIPEDLKKRFHKTKEFQYSIDDGRGEKLLGLESEIKEILTENQLIVIDTFKPCVIPPAQGKIGQSVEASGERIVRMLSRIRRMNRNQYELMKEMLVDFHLDKVEKHVGFNDAEEKENYRQDVLDLFEEARKMSDKDFFLQKAELANKLIPEDKRSIRRRKNQLSRVGKFMLDPALIPILKMRLEQG